MTIEQVIKIIATDGLTLLVTAWVLFYLFKVANVFYLKFERKMIAQHSKDLKEKRPMTIEKNNLIQQLLYKAMFEFWGDRAYIFEYHNGGHSISGIDFLKVSNTFEVCNTTIQHQQILLQNLPVWVFAFWNMNVLNKKTICRDVDDVSKEDLWAYQVLKQNGVQSVSIVWLYDAKGLPIGFLGIDYITGKKKKMTNEKRKQFEKLSYQVSGILY